MRRERTAKHGSKELHIQDLVEIRAVDTNLSTIFVWVIVENID